MIRQLEEQRRCGKLVIGKINKRAAGLYPLHSEPKKHKLFGFDTETYNRNKDFLMGSIVGENYSKQFFSVKEMCAEIASNFIFKNSWFFATNLGFDLGALMGTSRNLIANFEVMLRGSDFIFATTYVNHGLGKRVFYHPSFIKCLDIAKRKNFDRITFVDTLSHFKASVNELGKIVNLPKYEAPSCLGLKPANKKEFDEMAAYNLRDSLVTYKFASWLQEMYNSLGATMKFTAPSTAMDLFRRHFLKAPLISPERENILLSYNPYYGGRTEAFKRGHYKAENYGSMFVYDVNSLYPYVMKNFEYPIPAKYHTIKNGADIDFKKMKGFGYFDLTAPKDLYLPVLPVKADKLRFPVGIIKGWYDFASIKLALDYGYEINKASDCIIYEDSFAPFKNYVAALYEKRQTYKAENSTAELICKLMLNSLYGKWGQRFNNKETLMLRENLTEDIYKNNTIQQYTFQDDVVKVTTNDTSRIAGYILPILASYTTSYARNHLYKLLNKVGSERVFYCDTDSVFTTRKMSTSNDLGDIKLEKIFDECLIIKPKMYGGIMADKELIKIKGIRAAKNNMDACGIKDYATLLKMAEEGAVYGDLQRFIKFKSGFKEGSYINEAIIVPKIFDLNDNKRAWHNKWSLNPCDSNPIYMSENNY